MLLGCILFEFFQDLWKFWYYFFLNKPYIIKILVLIYIFGKKKNMIMILLGRA